MNPKKVSNDIIIVGFQERAFVLYQETIEARAGKHQDKSAASLDEVKECLIDPDVVTVTAHASEPHSDRHVYYRYTKDRKDVPPITRVVADHKEEPSPVVSWQKTSKIGGFSKIIYMKSGTKL